MKRAIVKQVLSLGQKIGVALGAVGAIALVPQVALSQAMSEYSALPPLSVQTHSQQSIMLAMSLDHQVFMKAYNDFSDLNKDGIPDTTFMPGYDYVGYFDPTLCYVTQAYTGGLVQSYFTPVGRRNAASPNDAASLKCASGQWSGNFLNWATMTRMDLVRQVLYGGYRYIDDPDLTVLERSYLPHDAHSFAKYVPLDDLDGFAVVPSTNSECSNSADPKCFGYTFCNTTNPPSSNTLSQDVNEPPLLRVVKGNYMLWDASERYQCLTTFDHYPSRGESVNPNDNDFLRATFLLKDNSEAKPIFGELPWNDNVRFDPAGANMNNPEASGIDAFPRSPLKRNVTDYVVRVAVCDQNYLPVQITDLNGEERESFDCTAYQNNYKPTGLLQRYGAGSSQYDVQFGLMGRSFDNNKGYGALRKNIGDFREEINPDGTFKSLADTPNSIVHNLDAIRVVDYLYDYDKAGINWHNNEGSGERGSVLGNNGTYQWERLSDAIRCDWGLSGFEQGRCRNWGNPFSQILAESYRYLTGASAPNGPRVSDGLGVDDWQPLAVSNTGSQSPFSCSAKGVLGFNASAVSYDWNPQFRSATPQSLGLPAAQGGQRSLEALTNDLGITGHYFIGSNSTNASGADHGLCTVKEVTALGEVSGTCPETPRLEGGYLGAGLANHVYEQHSVRTFGVSLTDALPRIRIPVNGSEIQIVPACRNVGVGNCALVTFKVIEDPMSSERIPVGIGRGRGDSTVERAGTYYVAWEDSEQGGDYDVDAAGLIRYEVLSNNTLVVETELTYNGTPEQLMFGYVISGTDEGGAIFPAITPGTQEDLSSIRRTREEGDTRIVVGDPTTQWCISSQNCWWDQTGPIETRKNYQRVTFNISDSTADFLPSPLKLAATVGSGIGEQGHAEVDDPSQLRTRLDTILRGLFNELKPGTGAGVSTNAITGEGLILSSLYSPELTHTRRDDEDNEVKEKITWVGHLNGLFYKDGMFWENCHEPDEPVITDEDCVVEIGLDEETQKTVFTRYTVSRNAEGELLIGASTGPHPYQELQSLWSADAELSKVDLPREQRGHDTASARRRHVLTAIAKEGAINATSGDLIPFTAANFSEDAPNTVGLGAKNYLMLDVADAEAAQDVVNYIRGDETLPNSRSRTLNGKKWLLGDIVHSSAALVGRPASNYDIDRIGDSTYSEFVDRYRNRRLVTYVGANDGMLHAFNGGFFNYNTESPGYLKAPAGVAVTEHELGAELWAYVPYNLLPHLKWLKDPNYSHVYYVDAKVHTFDVNIFSGNEALYPPEDYPNGWGTIIVVGMRFGGGDYPVDLGEGDERITRSAYIVMDVTNPEKPPRLLAELTDENLGFTTGDIDIMSIRRPNATTGSFENPAKNDWYLVFGSGPTGTDALKKAKSDQNAQLFHVRLNSLMSTVNSNSWVKQTSITDAPNAYVGGVTAIDWNSDFETDMLYIGVVGSEISNRGGLFQASVSHTGNTLTISTPSRLLDVELPFSRAPLVVRDVTHDGYWVYAATGEFMVSEHLLAQNIDDNWIYGLRVNGDTDWLRETDPAINAARDLKNISDVVVKTAVGDSGRSFTVIDYSNLDITTPEQMELHIRETKGWRKNLRYSPELAPSTPIFTGTTLAVTAFSPSVANNCRPGGESRVYWLNMFTGLPQTDNRKLFIRAGSDVSTIDAEGPGVGDVSDHSPPEFGPRVDGTPTGDKVVIGGSDGGLTTYDAENDPPPPVRRAWREVPISELD